MDNPQNIKPEEFKKLISTLLNDYIEIKKETAVLGYDAQALKLKDYIDYYVRLNNTN